MHVKVDEDLPKAAVQMLRDRGYEATSVVEQGMGGWKDSALWEAVQAKQQFLVTADKGFADVRFYWRVNADQGPREGIALYA